MAAACGPVASDAPVRPAGPLSPVPGSRTQIDVKQHASRPRLAIIRREGDPSPALVIAVAGGHGAAGHAALAGVLARRLRAAGLAADVHSDGIGIRAVATPRAEDLEAVLRGWVTAATAPVTTADVAAANARLSRLREDPLASPVLAGVASCSGDPLAVAADAKPRGAEALEELRRSALVMERTAIALVGAPSAGDAVSEALEEVDGWPRGAASAAERLPQRHGAFFSRDLAPGAARLHVAVQLADAVAAVGAAHRLRRGPPLSSKLDALKSPWGLGAIRAVAAPHGGCVRFALSPQAANAGHLDDLGVSAARAVRTVWREMGLQTRIQTDPFLVTSEIIGAGDARDAASRAAWWALSSPGDAPPSITTALEIGASGKVELTTDDGQPLDEATAHARYLQAVGSLKPADSGPVAGRRARAEPGQGQLWMLIGSPCPLRHEGQWDAGGAAVAATTVAIESQHPNVVIEPWVSADGVGIIAHGGVLAADESAEVLTDRIALAAAEAYTSVPHDASAFARAKRTALRHTAGGETFFTFARRALPDHPSWIAPWGSSDQQASVDLADAAARWRGVLHGPTRVAVLANHDASQAERAAKAVDHFLLPEAADKPCPEITDRDPPQIGAHAVRGRTPMVIVGVPYERSKERPLAELTAAALAGDDGPLRQALDVPWRVEVLGGAAGGALVITARVPGDTVEQASSVVVERLEQLAGEGLDAAAEARARAGVARSRAHAQRHPRARLIDLWRGLNVEAAPETEAWRAWLEKRAKKNRLVVVTAR